MSCVTTYAGSENLIILIVVQWDEPLRVMLADVEAWPRLIEVL